MTSPDDPHRNPWTDAEVERHWDQAASRYTDDHAGLQATHGQRFAKALEYLDLVEGCRVLNITSRDCEALDFIHRACPSAEVLNAEISAGLMAEAARLRPQAAQVKLSSYASLPFETGSFERILTLETLEHVPSPLDFLRELHRVAHPAARLVLSCPPLTAEWPYRIYTAFFGGHGEGPHRFLASREVKAMLAKTGWNLLRHEGTLLIPVGPAGLKQWGERLIARQQGAWLAEWGIRQFYVCDKQKT